LNSLNPELPNLFSKIISILEKIWSYLFLILGSHIKKLLYRYFFKSKKFEITEEHFCISKKNLLPVLYHFHWCRFIIRRGIDHNRFKLFYYSTFHSIFSL